MWKLGDRGSEHLHGILRYLGVIWERTDLYIFSSFGPILHKPILTCVNVMDVLMFDFTLIQ